MLGIVYLDCADADWTFGFSTDYVLETKWHYSLYVFSCSPNNWMCCVASTSRACAYTRRWTAMRRSWRKRRPFCSTSVWRRTARSKGASVGVPTNSTNKLIFYRNCATLLVLSWSEIYSIHTGNMVALNNSLR